MPFQRRDRGLVAEVETTQRIAVTVLAVALLVSLASSWYLLAVTQSRLARTIDMTREARLVYEGMLDREAGVLGYLATGEDTFLSDGDPTAADASADELVRALASEPELAPEVTRMLVARERWTEWADQAARQSPSETDRSEGRVTATLVEGKRLFDSYRDAQLTATDHIVRLRDDSTAAQRRAMVAALVANGLLLGSAVLQAFLRGRVVTRRVTGPVRGVLTTIDALRSGDLSARADRTGLHEVDEISAELGKLAGELQVATEDAAARETSLALLARRFEMVLRLARSASGSISLQRTGEAVAEVAADLLQAPTTLWVAGPEGRFTATRRSDDPPGVVPPSDLLVPGAVGAAAADVRPSRDATTSAYPLVLSGHVVGVLSVAEAEVPEDVAQVLDALLSTAAAAMESTRLHSSALTQAETDTLTSLPNRRRLDADLADEWRRSARYRRPFGCLMLDLDHFKRVNDDFGHQVGDAVLQQVSAAVARSLRSTDTAYRFGGEEIAVILRETDLDQAMVVGEHLREAVRAVVVPGVDRRITASVGVAAWGDAVLRPEDLLAVADAALYRAKRDGRDRVSGPLTVVVPV